MYTKMGHIKQLDISTNCTCSWDLVKEIQLESYASFLGGKKKKWNLDYTLRSEVGLYQAEDKNVGHSKQGMHGRECLSL